MKVEALSRESIPQCKSHAFLRLPKLSKRKNCAMIIAALILNLTSLQVARAVSEPQIAITGPDSDGITSIGVCITNPSEAIGTSVRFSSDYLGSGSFLVHSGTPACPSFGGVVIGQRLTSGQTYTFTASVTVSGQTFNISRTYTAPGEDPAVVAARQLKAAQDSDFRARQDAAIAAAEAESKAWNAANPGKQKCVQWGPVVHANGVSTASGGVCANPVEPGPGTTVATQAAPSVTAPAEPSTSSSSNTTSNNSGSSNANSSTTNSTSTTTTSTPETSTSTSPPATSFEEFPQWGSGTPYTKVLKGQLSTSQCPVGYQAANGIIVAIGTGTFTECWPENAWIAYRLGGVFWERFKSSGGTYDAKAEEIRRLKVAELKSLAKSVAQKAADETPGIQRCSSWSGYGESGQECAYTFIQPTLDKSSSSKSPTSNSPETSSATTATVNPSNPQTSISSSTADLDPYPNLKNGEEIPNTRISSSKGVSQSEWEASSVFKTFSCPLGSGKATGIDLNFTVTQSDDSWFAYCVKSWSSKTVNSNVDSSTATSSTTNPSSGSGGSSNNNSQGNSQSESATVSASQSAQNNSAVATLENRNSNSSSSSKLDETKSNPSLNSVAIQVSGTSSEVKALIGKVVEQTSEQKAMVGLLNLLDKSTSSSIVKNVKLPSSQRVDESAVSETPDICRVDGLNVTSLKKGVCIINYTVTDSDGNAFSTKKSINFKK